MGKIDIQKAMTAIEFGKTQDPKISGRRVTLLCNQGRVKGAQKLPGKTGPWLIPLGAKIEKFTRKWGTK